MSHKRNGSIDTNKNEMRTPPSLFRKLDDRFHFTVDIAATTDNQLVPIHYTEFLEEKAVLMWTDVAWCNPPYSPAGTLDKWLKKCHDQSLKGAVVVMLLPVDFSTRWWDYCMLASEWIRIKSRIHFNGIDNKPIPGSPLFDSVVVVFDEATRKKNGHIIISEMDWK